MPSRFRPSVHLGVVLLLAGLLGVGGIQFFGFNARDARDERAVEKDSASRGGDNDEPEIVEAFGRDDSAAARAMVEALLRDRFNRPHVRADEAVLVFKDAEAYRRFLAQAGQTGWQILGRIDGALAIRVRVADYDAFVRELAANPSAYASVTANVVLAAPTPPRVDRAGGGTAAVGANLLSVLGVPAESAALGQGVTIAVLDGGVVPDPTFGSRLRYLDIGYGLSGLGDDARHGTAVASIAAGAAADAPGVAPGATVLSIRVTGPDGLSDTFSAAQGIYAAVDAGAQIINLSLGGYATTRVMGEAIDYALAAEVAVVASSGNDRAAQLVWPAAYAGVVSVGAVDARGVQTNFSNSGEGLQLTAPGYAVQAAGVAGERILFSGTSASAPVVAGSIARLVSQSPGISPLQAADRLANYANDGGVAGEDADYGRGTVNLGWALDAGNSARIDPAISSQTFDPETGQLSIVVQNRGAQVISGLVLSVSDGEGAANEPLPALAPGGSATVTVGMDADRLRQAGGLSVSSRLRLPTDLADQDLTNNQSGVILKLEP